MKTFFSYYVILYDRNNGFFQQMTRNKNIKHTNKNIKRTNKKNINEHNIFK
jgi:hypothetical protein